MLKDRAREYNESNSSSLILRFGNLFTWLLTRPLNEDGCINLIEYLIEGVE